MAEVVAKLGIKRDKDFMYYIKNGDVWRVPRKQPGQPKGKPEKIHSTGHQQDYSYIYFLDKNGNLARAKRAVGGQKRKKTAAAAKRSTKKPVKKAAKKAPAKKGGAKKGAKKAKR